MRRRDRPAQPARRRYFPTQRRGRAASPRCRGRPREALADREALAIGVQRAGKIALRNLHVADIPKSNGEVTLPARVAGIQIWRGARLSRASCDRRPVRRRDRPAQPARRRYFPKQRRGHVASSRCWDQIRRGARLSRASCDRRPVRRRDRPAQPARRRYFPKQRRGHVASSRCWNPICARRSVIASLLR